MRDASWPPQGPRARGGETESNRTQMCPVLSQVWTCGDHTHGLCDSEWML